MNLLQTACANHSYLSAVFVTLGVKILTPIGPGRHFARSRHGSGGEAGRRRRWGKYRGLKAVSLNEAGGGASENLGLSFLAFLTLLFNTDVSFSWRHRVFGSPSISACASWRCPRFCMKFHQSVCARKSSHARSRSRSLSQPPCAFAASIKPPPLLDGQPSQPSGGGSSSSPRRGRLSGQITGRSMTDRAVAKTGCVCFEVFSGDEWLPRNDRTLN